jgi:UDP-N-acetylglucosamine 2-epimerase (non-hydrolysing)
VTVREETEWHETVDCGWNVLVPPDAATIRDVLERFEPPSSKPSLYGDGTATERIVAVLDGEGGSDLDPGDRGGER